MIEHVEYRNKIKVPKEDGYYFAKHITSDVIIPVYFDYFADLVFSKQGLQRASEFDFFGPVTPVRGGLNASML